MPSFAFCVALAWLLVYTQITSRSRFPHILHAGAIVVVHDDRISLLQCILFTRAHLVYMSISHVGPGARKHKTAVKLTRLRGSMAA